MVVARDVEVLLLHLLVQLFVQLVLPQQTLQGFDGTLGTWGRLLELGCRARATCVMFLVCDRDLTRRGWPLDETLLVDHKYITDFLVCGKSKILDLFTLGT